MSIPNGPSCGAAMVAEMKEFAAFEKATQRFIRRSLDVGLGRRDAVRRWSRDPMEAAAIRAQRRAYSRLDQIRAAIPDDVAPDAAEPVLGPLISLTGLDLATRRLPSFAAYRFLYERLIGGRVRPWLPGAFCAAAALPHLHPDTRRVLLSSLSESVATAAGWSMAEPRFLPEWVEKVEPVFVA